MVYVCNPYGMYFKHGHSNRPEYKAWQQIKARCLNPNHTAYPDYGGRGISVYDQWADDFEAFFSHVGPRPSAKHSLDRLENDKGYEPGNLAWRTRLEQNNNRRPHRAHGVKAHKAPSGKVSNFKHGRIRTPEYNAWISMKDRCLNPHSSNYPNWGGRGVSIFQPWVEDFMAFYGHVGPKPSPQHSLDRFPNHEGNYEPGNVRWATKKEQRANQRPYTTGPTHGNFDHGGVKKPEYKTWSSIKTRCFNPKHDKYTTYGGSGITMCTRWREDFAAFLTDLGSKPTPDHTLARKNHDGNYSCGKCVECLTKGWVANCQWATKTEQNRNRKASSRSGKLTWEKVTLMRAKIAAGATHQEMAEEFGVGRSLVAKIGRGEIWKPTVDRECL